MGIRYSYSNYTTKGHGVIESGGHDHNEMAYSTGKMPSNAKFARSVNHVDKIASVIKYMNPSRKREFIATLKTQKGLRVGKTIYVKMISDGNINVYKIPQARSLKRAVNKKSIADGSSYDQIYKNLKRINDRARAKTDRSYTS